jgi:hypothetical protein
MMGDYNDSSTRAKVIWTIGDSWPIGNMYGLAYEYNGSYGHHLALKNNGTTYHRISFSSQGASMSGTWQASSSLRAPIFYDSNSTSYYTNPASGSVMSSLSLLGNQLIVQGGSPTIYMRDTNNYTSMIHQNSNVFYVLSGRSNNTTSWSTYNGYWPMTLSMVNNDAQFGGNMRVRYNIIAYSSDERLKTNIKPIENALEKLCSLRGVTFDWNDEAAAAGFTPEQRYNDVGVLAQDVEKVLPQLVMPAPFDLYQPEPGTEYVEGELSQAELLGTSKSGKNYKTVEYGRMVALTIEAIKEQQTIINNQQQEINDLKDMVSKLVEKLS